MRGTAAYKKVYLETASPLRVLDELYGRLLSDMAEAARAISDKDTKAKSAAVDHAIRILIELTGAIDHRVSPVLSGNLAGLYEYVNERIMAASISMDAAPLRDAEKIISALKEAFNKCAEV